MVLEAVSPDFDLQWYIDEGFGNPLACSETPPKENLIISAALTGMVPTRADSPYVPLTEEEIIADAIRCSRAGAAILHLHARDRFGQPTYRQEVYHKIILEIRMQCPDVIICVSTSGRVHNEFQRRSEVLNLEGDAKPDMASLTLGSMNFPKEASINTPEMIARLAAAMAEKQIKPELEVFETGMLNYAAYLIKKGLLRGKVFCNFLLGSLGTMPARICDIEHLKNTMPTDCIWAAAGIGRFQLPVNIAAIKMGGHVRVGLEDNLFLDYQKQELATNEQLVSRLVAFSRFIGREVATPTEARHLIGLRKE
jgi:uncharacterized protein (DUF849 family)